MCLEGMNIMLDTLIACAWSDLTRRISPESRRDDLIQLSQRIISAVPVSLTLTAIANFYNAIAFKEPAY